MRHSRRISTEEPRTRQKDSAKDHGTRSGYLRFGAMILTSALVMFALTYTNVFSISHIWFSQERAYMALLMGAAMAIVMLGFMWRMHPSTKINTGIIAAAVALFALGFGLSQSQTLIGDQAYMKGMIPHHSIAILTSERADIRDVRVRELANGIADTQRKEIKEMEWLIDDIAKHGIAATASDAERRPVPDFSVAL